MTEVLGVEPDSPRAPSRLRFWIAVVASLVAIVILCGLGTWQVDRLFWKQAIIAQIADRIHAAPVELAEVERRFAENGDVEYVPVRLRGSFVNEGERYFLSTFEERAGWNVYTPLRLDDGRFVFVNRGFVPYDGKDPAKRSEGQLSGMVDITGLARNPPPEKPSSMMPDNDPGQNVFFWKNVAEMAVGQPASATGPFLPFFVDAGPGRAPGGYPIGGVTIVDIPNNHLQYAFTWYGLAAVLAVMLVMFLVRSRRPPSSAGKVPKG